MHGSTVAATSVVGCTSLPAAATAAAAAATTTIVTTIAAAAVGIKLDEFGLQLFL